MQRNFKSYQSNHMEMKNLKRIQGWLYFVLLLIVLASCQGGNRSADSRLSGDTIPLKYSKLLTLVQHEGYTEAVILNPWKEKAILHTYLLVPKGKSGDKMATQLQADLGHLKNGNAHAVDIVRTPISSSVVTTAPHCQLLYELHSKNAITGVCDANYINILDVKRRVALYKGKSVDGIPMNDGIVDCGSSMQPDVERMIALHPEAIVISPFENSGGYGKLDKLGIPIIEAADYMETSPLGRAEWMKFYGLLFASNNSLGDSLFSTVEKEYLSLKSKAAQLPQGLSVLTERKTGSVWYVPGGQSTMGILLRDAHAKYIFAADKHSGSLALSSELIIAKGNQVDVWAFKYFGGKPLSCADLLLEYKGYQALHALKTKNIYECDTQSQPYFEETSFHPEILLREFILLSHPNLENQRGWGKLRFYKKINRS